MVLVLYEAGCGGKFVVNCLGLSKDSVLQDAKLVNLTPEDKHALLLSRLEYEETSNWTDLSLGDHQLFGIDSNEYTPTFDYLTAQWNKEVKDTIGADKYLFSCVHVEGDVDDTYQRIWPNSWLIKLSNCTQFRQQRELQKPTIIDTSTKLSNPDFVWDAQWFLDRQQTVDQMHELYEMLHLPDYNPHWVGLYYDAWQKKWQHPN